MSSHRSTQHPGFTQQLLQARLDLHRAIQRFLEGLPLCVVEHELATIRQRLRGRRHARVEQELADVLVAGARGFLQQLLDRRAGANVNAFGLGKIQGAHGAPPD